MQRFLVASLLILLATPMAAAAQRGEPIVEDLWSEPNPGVRYLLRRTDLPVVIHALVVDLDTEGVRVETTRHEDRWQSVGDYARRRRLAAAVNGGFWSGFQRPMGVQAGGGEAWPGVYDDDEFGFFAIDRDGDAFISPPEELRGTRHVAEAVSGRPLLVWSGRVHHESLDDLETAHGRAPRTAVGVSRDGRKVFLVVVDGRQLEYSRGVTMFELARLFIELGAHAAINLDGGGSSAMFVENVQGVVSAPSGGRWEVGLGLGAEQEELPAGTKTRRMRDGSQQVYVRGVEREVMNHIGVVARDPAPVLPAGVVSPLDEPPLEEAVVLPPRPPLLRFGKLREVVFPVAYAAVALVPVGGLVWLRRRRRRRRRRSAMTLTPSRSR